MTGIFKRLVKIFDPMKDDSSKDPMDITRYKNHREITYMAYHFACIENKQLRENILQLMTQNSVLAKALAEANAKLKEQSCHY